MFRNQIVCFFTKDRAKGEVDANYALYSLPSMNFLLYTVFLSNWIPLDTLKKTLKLVGPMDQLTDTFMNKPTD